MKICYCRTKENSECFSQILYKKLNMFKIILNLKKYYPFYLMLILPSLYYIIFKYLPIFGNIIAFRRYKIGGSLFGEEWVGLRYFSLFVNDPYFWQVFKNTFILGVCTMFFNFPMPIVLALSLNEVKNAVFKRFVQTASYLPHFFTVVVVTGIIKELLSPSMGMVNELIKLMNHEPIHFLQKPEWFRPIYVISEVWQTTGWGAIIYMAAISNISPELYQSAEIDGANRWQQALNITLPSLAPTAIILFILNSGKLIDVSMQKILLLYNPMTYSTADTIETYIYRVGMEMQNYSYSTAVGIFNSFLGILLVSVSNYIAGRVSETTLW